MIVQYDPAFLTKLKKGDVRISKAFKERIDVFKRNPHDLQLNNHKLHDKYAGYRSIDITNDYRALYEEVPIGDEVIAYFSLFGTHKELYQPKTSQ